MLVNDLTAWQEWAVWFAQDPSIQTTFSDPSAGAGAHYEWVGNQWVGEGRLDLVAAKPDHWLRVRIEMNDATFRAEGDIALAAVPEGTEVTWNLGGELGRDPFARLNRGLLQNAVGGTLQASLENLKRVAEGR